MTPTRSTEYLAGLVRELCKLSNETEWAEFKVNKADPQEIGEYLSALANAAALAGKPFAYLAWGVENATHAIVGTQFAPASAKVGNEELESWLLQLLTPKVQFRFFEVEVDGRHVVLLEVERAYRQPVQFQGLEYIRVGSYKKKLKDFPEKERALWRIFDRVPFEGGRAREHATEDEVLQLLDYPSYFDLLGMPLPEGRQGILTALSSDGLIPSN
jgi:predicted HTH transcriptional regulator